MRQHSSLCYLAKSASEVDNFFSEASWEMFSRCVNPSAMVDFKIILGNNDFLN